MTKILPFTMVALSVGSALVYAYFRDWRHATYWAAASVLTLSVTL